MEEKILAESLKKIEMPGDMRVRILHNCYREVEEIQMKRNRNIFRRPAAVFAALILCFACIGMTGAVASGKLQGYFKDIRRWDGAVTGETYEQADEELTVHVMRENELLTAEVTMNDPGKFPYSELETLKLHVYEIRDGIGNTVIRGEDTEPAEIRDGMVRIVIPAGELESGEYTLIVQSFAGEKKADQPLVISGSTDWTCKFSY